MVVVIGGGGGGGGAGVGGDESMILLLWLGWYRESIAIVVAVINWWGLVPLVVSYAGQKSEWGRKGVDVRATSGNVPIGWWLIQFSLLRFLGVGSLLCLSLSAQASRCRQARN